MTPPSPGPPGRVALMSGICTRHDAISNVVRLQEELLADAGYDVRVYVQHTDFPGGRHVAVSDPWLLQRDEWYPTADLVVLHFGIRYGLFDSLGLSHAGVRVVHFHNVTPPDLLTGASREAAILGIDQLSIASRAERIWSDSTYNTDCLLEWTDVDPASVVPMQLCTPWADATPGASGERERQVIAVGRLVPAKGQLDLVDAVAALAPEVREGLEVDLIGSSDASDPAYIAQLRDRISAHGLDRVVRVELDLSDDALRDRYEAAAVFVSTSRHEGFCVPVIEAIASGCRVVSTDAGALPETVGPCGSLVAVGDIEALSSELGVALSAGPLDALELSTRDAHLQTYSRESFRRRLLDEVADLLSDGTVG
jgi:glycosyltransferase involved in cell wall biosynthesis